MPSVFSEILIKGPVQAAWQLASEMEKYPEYMENVVAVKVLERDDSDHTTITSWITNVDGRKITWVEKDCFDLENLKIVYKQIVGDLKKFQGEWSFRQVGDETLVTLSVDFEFGIPMLSNLLNPVVAKKVKGNCEAMLKAIKAQVEKDNVQVS
ncbi:MAG TPA: aromatase/cyclase [Bacillota bacterium]|nr:aromatase/cyclase [Bacillota bacterium]